MKTVILLLSSVFFFSISTFGQATNKLKEIDLLLFAGEFNSAIDSLIALEKTDSLNSNLYLKLGTAHQGLYKHDKAKTYLLKSIKIDSLNVFAYKALANSFAVLGQSLAAEKIYKIALSLDPTNVPMIISLCKILKENHKFTEAKNYYSKLINIDSENSLFYQSKAFCCMKLEQDTTAIENYKLAIKYNESNISNFVSLGHLYNKTEQTDSALFYISKGLIKNKHHPILNRLKADINLSQKKYFEAVHNYGNAIAFGDSTYQNYQKLGLSYYFIAASSIFKNLEERNKKYKTCIDAFMKSYKMNNKDQLTCMYLGIAHKEIDEYNEAEKYFHFSLSNIFPDYLGDIYYQIADTYYKNKKLSQAIVYAKKSVEHSPQKIIYMYTLATICDQYYKDKKIALKYYKKFIASSEGLDERIIEYSKDRILAIKEILHFEGRL